MIKAFALKSLMGSISQVTLDRSQLEKLLENDPFGGMAEIVEINYNDAPLTEVGEKIKADLLTKMTDKNLINFKADWGPGFYELSADDRMKLVYDLLTEDHGEPIRFNDSHRAPKGKQPEIDLECNTHSDT